MKAMSDGREQLNQSEDGTNGEGKKKKQRWRDSHKL